MRTKLSDVIVKALVDAGAGAFFVFTGGAISHVIDSLARISTASPPYYCFQNEQAAAFAAEAYSRNSPQGLLGVTLTTSGPGASNLLSGIAGAWYDCIPAVYVTGQVRTWELGIPKGRLQGGFQELDIVSMAKSVTKYAKTLTDPSTVRAEILKAVELAKSGRPGPVVIDIPMDLQFETVETSSLDLSFPSDLVSSDADVATLGNVIDRLKREISVAKKPLLLVGGGVRHANAIPSLQNLVRRSGFPTISTYAAVDVLGTEDASYLGVMGQFGSPLANAATGECDLIIALGSRFAQKQLGNSPDLFAPSAKVVSVNIDKAEMAASPRKIDVAIDFDLKSLLEAWLPQLQDSQKNWVENSNLEAKGTFAEPDGRFDKGGLGSVSPYSLANRLVESIGSRPCIVALDVGQNVVASVQRVKFPRNVRIFSSWGNSPMGYSLPAAIGAWIANPGSEIVCVIGDGGFQVNIQELQTIVQYRIPVKILLWNNHAYVTIHEYQDGNLESRYEATDASHGYSHPDFVAVAQAYGIRAHKLQAALSPGQLEQALFDTDQAVLLEVEVDPSARLSPSVKGSSAVHEMTV
jgi:acetolactate synthase-1/2/3 large subunit